MDQNQTIDNDLQKAIDDITNTTNVDPVFSDPVAAPSSVPEGDTGELGEPIGPFPSPATNAVTPESVAPLEPASVMEPEAAPLSTSPVQSSASFSEPAPATDFTSQTPPTDFSAPAPTTSSFAPQPSVSDSSATIATTSSTPVTPDDSKVAQIKAAALHALVPIIDKLNLGPTQKFDLCRDILEELKDTSVLEPAYQTALDIADESERAEALLYLVESIDKM